jgi:hypothetical protein
MQLLESSDLGLRSARLTLASRLSPTQITLFPMVHVGEANFFKTVYEDAFSHDVTFVEGIRSPIVRRITRSYRWIEGSKGIDLTVQPPYPTQQSVHARIILADLSEEEFAIAWRQVPIWLQAVMLVGAPAVGARYRWFGSRETLAGGLSLEDLPRRQETLSWNPETATLNQAILNARDARLIERLGQQLDNPTPGVRRIAVVYGACHMRAVLRALTGSRGYYAKESSWITVFTPTGSMTA